MNFRARSCIDLQLTGYHIREIVCGYELIDKAEAGWWPGVGFDVASIKHMCKPPPATCHLPPATFNLGLFDGYRISLHE